MTQGEIQELLLQLANEVAREEKIPLKVEHSYRSVSASMSEPEKLMLEPFKKENDVLKCRLWYPNGPSGSSRTEDLKIPARPYAFKDQVRSVLRAIWRVDNAPA